MGTVAYRLRSTVRNRAGTVLTIALLVAISGTVVLSTAAGARRSTGSVGRLIDKTEPIDVFVFSPDPIDDEAFAALRAIDGVAAIGRVDVPALSLPAQVRKGRGSDADNGDVTLVASVDEIGGSSVRPWVRAGRLADPRAPLEVNLNEGAARSLGVGVDDTVEAVAYAPDQGEAFFGGEEADPAGPRFEFEVVGVTREVTDFGQGEPNFPPLTPAFLSRHGGEVLHFGYGLLVRLEGGVVGELGFFSAARPLVPAGEFDGAAGDFGGVYDAVRVATTSLALFSAVAAFAMLAAFAVVVGRASRRLGSEHATLGALGLTRGQQAASIVGAVGGGVAVGVVGAVIGAAFASRFFPIGVARKAEPELGLHLDPLVLGLGGLILLGLLMAITTALAWRSTNRAGSTVGRPPSMAPKVTSALSEVGLSAPAVTGVDIALRGGSAGRRTPNWSALVGVAVASAGLLAALGFTSSLDRLVEEPERWGWDWDLAGIPVDDGSFTDRLVGDDDIEAIGHGRFVVEVELDDRRRVAAQGMQAIKGSIAPSVVEGRAPVRSDEVALGIETLDALDKGIGDAVTAPCGDRSCRFTIVGQALLYAPGETVPLAEGASFTLDALDAMGITRESDIGEDSLVLRWAPGVDGAAAADRLGLSEAITPRPHADVVRLDDVGSLPWYLGGFLALIGALTVGYALITGIQARRRELGVLRTIGFVHRQVSATVTWQATTLVVLGLVVGVPLGAIIGRWSWAIVAEGLGVATDARWPWISATLIVGAMIVAANLVAAGPAWAARRTSPADALRSE